MRLSPRPLTLPSAVTAGVGQHSECDSFHSYALAATSWCDCDGHHVKENSKRAATHRLCMPGGRQLTTALLQPPRCSQRAIDPEETCVDMVSLPQS
jgi:hypothetical protein